MMQTPFSNIAVNAVGGWFPLDHECTFFLGYILSRLPEVSGMRQPAVQLGKPLQHACQLGERWPVVCLGRPAGR